MRLEHGVLQAVTKRELVVAFRSSKGSGVEVQEVLPEFGSPETLCTPIPTLLFPDPRPKWDGGVGEGSRG